MHQGWVFLCLEVGLGSHHQLSLCSWVLLVCRSILHPCQELFLWQKQPKIVPSLSVSGHAASLHPTGAPCASIHAYKALFVPGKDDAKYSQFITIAIHYHSRYFAY